ncbi:hypothetical protein [Streptomyces sp. NPDC050485]|uniref:hypothetical protein n=1 Tax=Streptomyces sp. NPDC050485 TaxID=3365617 RepID=UPI0037A142C3
MRTERASRLAACTALILSAGMLLAGPASADSPAPHVPTASAPRPAASASATLPHQPATLKAPRAPAAKGAVRAKPRFDVNGDAYTDMLYRDPNDSLYLETWTEKVNPQFANSLGAYKDLILPGDLGGGAAPEVLDLSPTGVMALHADVSGSGGLGYGGWSSSGWNMYNKVISVGDVSGDGKPDLMARTPSGGCTSTPAPATRRPRSRAG